MKATTPIELDVSLVNEHGTFYVSLNDGVQEIHLPLPSPKQARKFITTYHPKARDEHEVLR